MVSILTYNIVHSEDRFLFLYSNIYASALCYFSFSIQLYRANSLLLKVNQIGTVSESMDAAKMIFNDRGNVIVSHRSGETPSAIISDLAVAIGAQFIKTGATARGERVSKYNRLLAIEEYLQRNNLL
jgi:enolase